MWTAPKKVLYIKRSALSPKRGFEFRDSLAACPVSPAQVSGGGKAKYDAKRHALVWKFKKFPGESEASLTASAELIATTKEKRQWARPPIQLQFQVRATLRAVVRFGIWA